MKDTSMDFETIFRAFAIQTYLKGYGYVAQVDKSTPVCYVQDPTDNGFLVRAMPTWDIARQFIKDRT